jgi:hypothetical protein
MSDPDFGGSNLLLELTHYRLPSGGFSVVPAFEASIHAISSATSTEGSCARINHFLSKPETLNADDLECFIRFEFLEPLITRVQLQLA